ncbi:nitronate monooxygenase [Coraliomargarita sp. SDUM461003]|uniref:Nitronate monooxygenase n=1 Tax=Thalassobacterium maritimum TaxID=3041265 RepID=A0ABU1AYH1_9BACT|nr:nitronate monooxygenase [Coraliomargarita sp. SDUM461003]MDQ8208299.1 nitronate monooxygenase [Coraliomargarita sp. SDUM461003]
MFLPKIIQGGMGAGVSDWKLANSVASAGQLGVISGTALDTVMVRRLQLGDIGGHMRRGLAAFPVPAVAERILGRYYKSQAEQTEKPLRLIPGFRIDPTGHAMDLAIAANFVEVFLAKEGHDGHVGVNYLEKIQLPNLTSMFGAMLAGVDNVLMGAGIPRTIPGILDSLAEWKPVEMRINVEDADKDDAYFSRFDPLEWIRSHLPDIELPKLKRPDFFPIISSNVLALTLAKKSTGKVNGFIVERHIAGGHNAPPRGGMKLDENDEPIYGPKDEANLAQLSKMGIPFWLAGGGSSETGLKDALAAGAAGIQVGTAFAYCDESGFDASIKKRVLEKVKTGEAKIFTDSRGSPTGFPFKVVNLEGTLFEPEVYESRKRICDLCYLRHPYKKADATIGYRCPSEPVKDYIKKGGKEEDTVGRKCLCNGLMAAIGMPQKYKDGGEEPAMVTSGDDVTKLSRFVNWETTSYSSQDVIKELLSQI